MFQIIEAFFWLCVIMCAIDAVSKKLKTHDGPKKTNSRRSGATGISGQNMRMISVDPKDMELAKYELNNRGISYTQAGGFLVVDPSRTADAMDAMEFDDIDAQW